MKRKARDEFRAHKQDADPAALSKLWSHAKEELEAVRRQAMVYHLYARQHKSVMVSSGCTACHIQACLLTSMPETSLPFQQLSQRGCYVGSAQWLGQGSSCAHHQGP